MPLRHAQPGQAAVPAADYNAMIDMARNHYAGLGQHHQTPASPPAGDHVYIRNDSGQDVPRFGVLMIDGPIFGSDTPDGPFSNPLVISGVMPAADGAGKIVVISEPIKAGEIGRGLGSGIVQVKLSGGAAYPHATAGLQGDETGWLEVGKPGAEVLWDENHTSSAGIRWGLVRLGGYERVAVVRLTSELSNGRYVGIEQTFSSTQGWEDMPGGRVWGSGGGHPEVISIRETRELDQEDEPIFTVREYYSRRVVPVWILDEPAKQVLPDPGQKYQVLQLLAANGELQPAWDWVRAH